MPTSDRNPERNDPLDDSINRLETFIDETEIQGNSGVVPVLTESAGDGITPASPNIPVLDEMVSDKVMECPASDMDESSVSEEQLMGLIDKLEDRLTGVLETLVKSMKDEMIDAISEEVKMQLDNYQNKPDSRDRPGRTTGDEPDLRQPGDYPPFGE